MSVFAEFAILFKMTVQCQVLGKLHVFTSVVRRWSVYAAFRAVETGYVAVLRRLYVF